MTIHQVGNGEMGNTLKRPICEGQKLAFGERMRMTSAEEKRKRHRTPLLFYKFGFNEFFKRVLNYRLVDSIPRLLLCNDEFTQFFQKNITNLKANFV